MHGHRAKLTKTILLCFSEIGEHLDYVSDRLCTHSRQNVRRSKCMYKLTPCTEAQTCTHGDVYVRQRCMYLNKQYMAACKDKRCCPSTDHVMHTRSCDAHTHTHTHKQTNTHTPAHPHTRTPTHRHTHTQTQETGAARRCGECWEASWKLAGND